MSEQHNKYLKEISLVFQTMQNFKREILAIEKILLFLKKTKPENLQPIHFDQLSYEFWKFYRAFKMKEFILLYKERIKAEINSIDSTSNKTIEMLDRAFLWHITNWSNDSKRKYEQRFYSEMALNNFKINKVSYYKLSIANRNILIDLINEINNDTAFNKIVPYPKKNEKNNNEQLESGILDYLESVNLSLIGFIKTSKIEDLKCLIHAFACQSDSKIQLDHVLNRIAIKKYIENLCNSFNYQHHDLIINQINNAVDLILPYMFGSVVHKEENDKLKSNLDINSNLHDNIWKAYKEHDIKMFDFDIPNESVSTLIEIVDYDKIKIHNPYDSILLKDKVYNWCYTNEKWI